MLARALVSMLLLAPALAGGAAGSNAEAHGAPAAPPAETIGEPIPETRNEVPWQDLFAVRLLAPSLVAPGEELRFRVVAYSPYDREPRTDVEIEAGFELKVLDGEERAEARVTAAGRTGPSGVWVGEVVVPDGAVRADSGDLVVHARVGEQERRVEARVTVLGTRAYLSTDKALYRPGERLHMRGLWAGSAPLPAGARARFEVADPRGRRVFDAETSLSESGIAHTAWEIPETITPGSYRVGAEVPGAGVGDSRRVRIAPFERAPFVVTAEPERPVFLPGHDVSVAVEVRTLLGAPVSGARVEVESEEEPEPRRNGRRQAKAPRGEATQPGRATAERVTDAEGRTSVPLDLGAFWRGLRDHWVRWSSTPSPPYRDVDLVATVTHPVSGRRESARAVVRLSPEPIHVYTPIRRPSRGRPLFVTTFGADGEPRACRVWVTVRDKESRDVLDTAELETNRYGAGSIPWTELLTEDPPDPDRDLLIELEAHAADGRIGHRTFTSTSRGHPPALVLDAPRTLLAPGEPVKATLRTRGAPDRVPGPVLIELEQNRRILDSRRVDSLEEPVELKLDPRGATGPLVVAAHRLQPAKDRWPGGTRGAIRRFLVLGAKPPPTLRLEADADEYRPGETAHVRLAVETADREPPGPVALGVAAVDRAVELRQRREGLADGPALLEALPKSRGRTLGAWSLERIARLEPDEVPAELETVAEILLADVSPEYRPTDTDDPIGASRRRYESHFHRQFEPVDEALEQAFRWPRYVQPADVESLRSILAARGVTLGTLHDPWGNAYRFRVRVDGDRRRATAATAGRDGRWGTVDDFTVWGRSWRYGRPVGEPIGWILEERLEDGELLRDLSSLRTALAGRGVELGVERDPWGRFYRYELVSRRGHYGWEVWSAGPDADCAARPRWDRCGVRVWSAKVDYGRALERTLGPQMNRAVEAVLEAESGTRRALAEAPELSDRIGERIDFPWPDPWGRPFRLEGALEVRYADLSVQRSGTDGEGFLESEPVRARDLVLRVRSGGPDRRFDTDDDRTVTRWVVPLEWSGTDGRWREIAAAAAGEGEGLLAGRVTDTDGAALPGVRLEVSGVGMWIRTQFSGPGGRFNLHLPAGAYRASLALEGFSTVEYESVRVRAGHTTWIDVALSPAVEEVITVTSESPLLDAEPTPPPGPPERPPISTPRVRRDLPDTLLWLPEVLTDEDGEARIEIPLADTITTWNVAALASTPDGPLATGELALRVSRPFFVRPDPPQTVTAGDRLEVPVDATNLTDRPLGLDVTLQQGDAQDAAGVGAEGETRRHLLSPPGEEVRTDLPASFPEHGESLLRVTATGDGAGDAVEKTVEVRPDGREEIRVESRLVGGAGDEDGGAVELRVPETAIPGTAALEITVYPDLRSHLVAAAAELLRRPTGGTEQVLSAAYPSLLLLETLSGTEELPDDLRHRARAHVATAVERLGTVQRADGGVPYWKGSEHADVTLTAYAVELLLDAEPDDAGVPHRARTAAGWLLRRQGEDGLWRNRRDDSSAPARPPEVARREAALVAGALARVRARLASPSESPGSGSQSPGGEEAHRLGAVADRSIDRAFEALEAPAESGRDAYLTAVYALAAHAHGNLERWRRATERLKALAVPGPNGVFWELRSNSPYAGWGLSGRAETTGLAVRALLADGSPPAPGSHAERGLAHLLLGHGTFGLWGSTQATVQALRALAAGLPAGAAESDVAEPMDSGTRLRLDGIDLGSPETGTDRFGPRRIGPGDHPALADLAPGRHRLEIRSGGSPWTLVQATLRTFVPWNGDQRTADSSDALVFERRCRPTALRPGETVECRVRAGRRGYRGRGVLVAELGLPPGAVVDRSELENAVERIDGFAHFEIRPHRVVLFLWPRARGVEVPVRFTPRFAADARSLRSVLYDDSNPTERVVLPPERFAIE